jgi:hypothetical protein
VHGVCVLGFAGVHLLRRFTSHLSASFVSLCWRSDARSGLTSGLMRSRPQVAWLRGLALFLARCCRVGADFRWFAHLCEPFAEAGIQQHCRATCCFTSCATDLPCPFLAFVAQGRAASLVTLLTDLPVVASVSDAGSGAVRATASWRAARVIVDRQAASQDGRVFVAVPRPSRVYAADAALQR